MKNGEKAKRISFVYAGLALILVMLMFTGVLVYAAYIHRDDVKEDFLGAKGAFYFYSDVLKDGEQTPQIYLIHDWDGVEDELFRFYLQPFKDSLNTSNMTIYCDVKAKIGSAEKTVFQNVEIPHDEGEQLKIVGVSDLINAGFALSQLTDDDPVSILISAVSTGPYKRTLRAEYLIGSKPEPFAWQLSANGGEPVAVASFTLNESEHLTEEVTITWPVGAEPDMTNKIVVAAVAEGKFNESTRTMTVVLNTAATYDLVFYKNAGTIANNYSGVTAVLVE